MKIDIDKRVTDARCPKAFFAIRLIPENNEEMSSLEWGRHLFNPTSFEIVNQGHLSYVVQFSEKSV